jgi:hypothetical protein
MKNKQGKSTKQTKDSTRFVFIGYIGIVIVMVALMLGVGEYTGFNQEIKQGLQNDPRPLSPLVNYMHPNTFEIADSIHRVRYPEWHAKMDSLTAQDSLELKDPDMIYLDTPSREEGKEGKSEYGEYEPSKWNQGPCGEEDIINQQDIDISQYSDEHVMWVGDNGDTIWD